MNTQQVIEELQCWNSFSVGCKVENCVGARDIGVVTRIHKGSPTGSTNTFIWVKWDSDGSHSWISNGEGLCCVNTQNECQRTVWNSVKDCLPELIEDQNYKNRSLAVLVSNKHNRQFVAYLWQYTDEPENLQWTADCSEGWDVTDSITHWMPLPQPPVHK